MNHSPISCLINSRHVSSQNEDFATLASAPPCTSPASRCRITVLQLFLKNLSRSSIGTFRPYPPPVGLHLPSFHAVAIKNSRFIDKTSVAQKASFRIRILFVPMEINTNSLVETYDKPGKFLTLSSGIASHNRLSDFVKTGKKYFPRYV